MHGLSSCAGSSASPKRTPLIGLSCGLQPNQRTSLNLSSPVSAKLAGLFSSATSTLSNRVRPPASERQQRERNHGDRYFVYTVEVNPW
jgi:hypothetical protein